MIYNAKDLKISRKYRELFPHVYKGDVITSNAKMTSFRVIYYDDRTYRRKLVVANTEDKIQFMYDHEFCIYWTLADINGERVFIYWEWPEEQGCP